MKFDCVLLYGNTYSPTSKYAGTFRISTELRQHGYSVKTIDLTAFNGFDDDLKQILDKVLGDKTLWIGVSTTFLRNLFGFHFSRNQDTIDKCVRNVKYFDTPIKKFVEYVKSINPEIKLIAGGSRRFLIEKFGFKIFKFYNDKEIIEFTNYCAGIAKRTNLKYESNFIEGSEFFEFPKSKIEFINDDVIFPNETLPIEVSRGCIFRCKFCAYPMNGKTKGEWIKRPNILLDELTKNYEIHNVTNYIISDDTYNDSPDKVKMLYDEVFSKLPFKIEFTAYLRLDLMMRFPDTIDYLKESGLKSVLFGIETINHESGKAIGKGVDPKLQFEFVKQLKLNQFKEISTHSGFIIGLPKDRPNEMELLEKFLFSNENYLDYVSVQPLYIAPGDLIHSNKSQYSQFDLEYEKYGYQCYEKIKDSSLPYIRWNNSNLSFNFDDALKFSHRINYKIENESDKFKYAGFNMMYIRSLGISQVDISNLSVRQVRAKYDLKKIINDRRHYYRQYLLNN